MTVTSQPGGPKPPKLPGYNVNVAAEGASWKRPQTLKWSNDFGAMVVPNPPARGTAAGLAIQDPAAAAGELTDAQHDAAAPAGPSTLPGWIKHANEVLRFFAYFTEEVPFSPKEPWRVRHCHILHYLEDSSTQVVENTHSEGIVDGVLVKRMLITKVGQEGKFIGPTDFTVGGQVDIFGRKLHVVDADTFTRDYVAATGTPLGPPIAVPRSPFDLYCEQQTKPSGLSRSDPDSPTRYSEALLGRAPSNKKLQKFLEGNSRVLCFFAVWDDTAGAAPGAAPVRRPFKLLFYLEDDTVEINELKDNNLGREFYRFMARGPLPKRHHPRGLALASQDQCIGPADLRIGGTVEVLGRKFLIHDADEFTKRWGAENIGWGSDEVVALDVSLPAPAPIKRELPPHSGFGDPDDTAYNCSRLIPAPPKPQRRAIAAVAAESVASGSAVLRFSAELRPLPGRPPLSSVDRSRRFVISFFLSDGTLAVYEPPVPNSGVPGGQFLERSKAMKKGSTRIAEADLWVGAKVELVGRMFELTDADEWTLVFMERLPETFPKADRAAALKAVRGAQEALELVAAGSITQEAFWTAVQSAVPGVTKHEAIAAARALKKSATP